ncbi:MAG TPA: HAD family hydrolase [Pseudomonas sp.]|jgi:FMN hydrolase / 5-amino-6-(5-phospho-D-ribitylamino)uracil phosphatase|uniref:HAD family hydrolase n=1 Tax=Stutzerimonas frequens TaxID=2968969 RepID=UPI000E889C96|nr:HAD family hydrolase [Stutzerimonas frequens]MDL0437971.1 HAD family hydrolase [Stutzerimonas frequens]QFU10866.1 Flavin mononucleotide phosphatase YigB [Stutzerimonas frequens]HAW60992.1 HAD family hydrolase [Pseudomonas sp.]|tara:strand:+ start:2346 stop:3047 length:702 start_codon:yes stop_codon:yes gene_type:complete
MSIRLITFDLDDTFWETKPAIQSAETVLRDWLAKHAPRLGEFPVEALGAIRRMLVEREPTLRHRVSELRRRILQHALGDAGYPREEADELAERAFQVFLDARHEVEIFPDVQPTLEFLANHYTLGVITNGNADVRRLGLADYFQFTLCAEELGIGKPDPHPFRQALRLGGALPEQAVHVGDHAEDDIAGAQQAGLRAVWFNPGQIAWTQDYQPDAQIRSLAELPKLLLDWRGN